MIKKRIYLISIAITIFNCAPEEEFKTPTLTIDEQEIEGNIITIDAVLGMMSQKIEEEGETAKAVFKDTNSFMLGYVVSSDKESNFFKELILQDKNENPTAGVRLVINKNPLFTKYEFGRKVYIQLDGLSIGIENGVPTIGVLNGNTVEQIPSFMADEVIIRSSQIAQITPLTTTFEDFTDALLNTYIKINDIQFNKSIVLEGKEFTFAAEPNDVFDGERIVESCTTGRSTILSTSTFSDFKGFKLPDNQGSFEGIFTKNFLGNRYNLVLNNPSGLVFDNDKRCDPKVLECEVTNDGTEVLFEEDFNVPKIAILEEKGWININTTNGKLKYKTGDFNDNQYVQITGFRSKESLYEVWFISPEIDVNMSVDEILNVDLQAGYDNGNILEVFVTDNFIADPNTAKWTKLDVTIPRGPLNAFGDFIPGGPISLSCIEGRIRIGFRYIGGDPRATTRYHIDNFRIFGK